LDRAPLAASLPRRSPKQASASRSSPRSTRDRLAGMRRGMSSGGSRTSREVHLAARPQGEPVASDFSLVDVDVADPPQGSLLVRNMFMSVDPYMRGRMNDGKSYIAPFQIGAPLDGDAVGTVIESSADGFKVGDTVVHPLGWRSIAVVASGDARKIDAELAEPQHFLGVLGIPGLTGYVGMTDIASLRSGDIVFVSAAAGAVGSLAGQVAKLRGHTVIGSAGSAEKVSYLIDELGFDAAFNYRDGPVRDQLHRAAPEGIDVYFDNVGGAHLEAALESLRLRGRVAMCGAISVVNAAEPPAGPRNMRLIIGKRLTLRGFIIGDHLDRFDAFVKEVGGWLRAGEIKHRETILDGIDRAPEALIGLLRGQNTGKMLVRL
jgi:NADPH-dependent curcumin reductase CurA